MQGSHSNYNYAHNRIHAIDSMINYKSGIHWELVVRSANGYEIKEATGIDSRCVQQDMIFFYRKGRFVEFEVGISMIRFVGREGESGITLELATRTIYLVNKGDEESMAALEALLDEVTQHMQVYTRTSSKMLTGERNKKSKPEEEVHAFLRKYHSILL